MQTTHLVYFSPTGATRQVVEAVGRGLGAEPVTRYDLTLPGVFPEAVLREGVAIIGVPVYAGRVPELFLERAKRMTAANLPAVLVAVYGNRAYEDALVELRDVVTEKGFRLVAAGAFIGEHSYSTPERPIAAGRPDTTDLQRAEEFGQQVAAKLANGTLDMPAIPGNVPYRQRPPLGGVAPSTDPDKCTLCGACAAVCPTGVVSVAESVVTNAENCVMCCACLRACNYGARIFDQPLIEERRAMLRSKCATPKAPELFL